MSFTVLIRNTVLTKEGELPQKGTEEGISKQTKAISISLRQEEVKVKERALAGDQGCPRAKGKVGKGMRLREYRKHGCGEKTPSRSSAEEQKQEEGNSWRGS